MRKSNVQFLVRQIECREIPELPDAPTGTSSALVLVSLFKSVNCPSATQCHPKQNRLTVSDTTEWVLNNKYKVKDGSREKESRRIKQMSSQFTARVQTGHFGSSNPAWVVVHMNK